METTEKNMEHGEHFNESIVNEVILEDMKKNRIDHMKYLPGMEVLEESDVMDQVISAMNAYDYDKYTEADVRRALAHDNRTPEDFQALLSPAALPLLEEIAQAAQKETRKHFGNSVYMFTPIYIANYCENYCIYCGFNCHNKIRRAKLNAEEIDKEMAAIAKTGLQEILILTGENLIVVVPTYAWRIPRVVSDWIGQTEFVGAKNVWYVMSCGSGIGGADIYNRKLSEKKGIKHMGTAQIIMPESKNNISGYPRKGQTNAKIIDYRRLINAVYVLLRESSQKYTFCKN